MPVAGLDPMEFEFCIEESQEVPDDRRLCNKFPCPEFVAGDFGPVINAKFIDSFTVCYIATIVQCIMWIWWLTEQDN